MAKGGYRGGMPMMGGMNQMQMMKQAQKMQQDLLKMQQEMETKEYEATAGGGAKIGSRIYLPITDVLTINKLDKSREGISLSIPSLDLTYFILNLF